MEIVRQLRSQLADLQVQQQRRQASSTGAAAVGNGSGTATVTLQERDAEGGRDARHLDMWRQDTHWADQVPSIQVSKPKGSFCQLNCTSVVALHPGAVFDVLRKTGDERIFRNAKGTKNIEVLEDTDARRVVEMETTTAWKFLFLSGEFNLMLRLTEDKPNRTIHFELSKPGFMKQFQGSWAVEPLPVPASSQIHLGSPDAAAPLPLACVAQSGSPSLASVNRGFQQPAVSTLPEDIAELALEAADTDKVADIRKREDPTSMPWYGQGTRLASRLVLTQQVHPSVTPPPMFGHYLRGIAAKTVLEAVYDIQLEAARIRYGIPEDCQVRQELEKRGHRALDSTEPGAAQRGNRDGQRTPSSAPGSRGDGPKRGKRDWGVADNKKSSSLRRSRRLSEKDKWNLSMSLKKEVQEQCPDVHIAVPTAA